jgi:hypothetical protein
MRRGSHGTIPALTESGADFDGFDGPGLRVSGTEGLLRRLEGLVAESN